ncbi:MAG: FtsX-like permease family protein [Candidatus Hodarchaeota archaeon]
MENDTETSISTITTEKNNRNLLMLFSIALNNIKSRIIRFLIIILGITLTTILVVIIRGYSMILVIIEDFQMSESILVYDTFVTVVCLGLVAISIISTIFLAITERTEEIGLYRTSGAGTMDIFLIFEIEILSIGLFGIILGNISGLVLLFVDLLRRWGINTLFSFIARYQYKVIEYCITNIVLILPFILSVVFIASIIPITIASRMKVVNALELRI